MSSRFVSEESGNMKLILAVLLLAVSLVRAFDTHEQPGMIPLEPSMPRYRPHTYLVQKQMMQHSGKDQTSR